jgi:hypothetical protein
MGSTGESAPQFKKLFPWTVDILPGGCYNIQATKKRILLSLVFDDVEGSQAESAHFQEQVFCFPESKRHHQDIFQEVTV